MIKAIIFLTKTVIATLLALLISSCGRNISFDDGVKGNGKITTESRTANADFKSIDVAYGIKLIVEQSNDNSITVEADENLQRLIVTKVENGVLKIEASEGYNSTETPKVTVKLPIINGLTSSAGASISSNNVLITENINVKSSSGSDIHIEVEADAITLETTSGSEIEASGKALRLETASASGSHIEADKLMANEVIARSSSGSSTNVYPIISLNAKASSGSAINYHKVPKTITKEESSGGSVSEN